MASSINVSAADRRVAEHWSVNHSATDAFSPQVYWLAVPEVWRRFQQRATQGKAPDWISYCVQHFLGEQTPVERICSLGCGAGELERHLAQLNAFQRCDAFDLAPGALEIARREADNASLQGIHYEVADLNALNLPESTYDAIWFNSSLHHVRELEATCDTVAAALKPGGFLFVNEYVGANRFDFSARQLEAIGAAFALLPERYRTSYLGGTAPVLTRPLIPNPRDVEATDPSESVRSSEIPRVIAERFNVLVHNKAGGTLLQYLLHGIAGNFRSDDPDSLIVLDMLFRIEDALIDTGDLPSDFDLIVARRRD